MLLASSAVNEKFFNEIDKLAPFGSANREPRFVIENVSITKSLILKEFTLKPFAKHPTTQQSILFHLIVLIHYRNLFAKF